MSTIITIKNGEFAGDYRTNFKAFNQRILSYKDNGAVNEVESISVADFKPILEAYEAERKAEAQTEQEQTPPTEQTEQNTPEPEQTTEKKEKKHPTADSFLKAMPQDTYIFKVNAKGHIRIFKTEEARDEGKACYCKLNPLKDGVWVLPRKDLYAARPDIAWEEKEGWASKYAYKASNWEEVAGILNLA